MRKNDGFHERKENPEGSGYTDCGVIEIIILLIKIKNESYSISFRKSLIEISSASAIFMRLRIDVLIIPLSIRVI